MSDQPGFDAIAQLSASVQDTVVKTSDQQVANAAAMVTVQGQIDALSTQMANLKAYDAKLTEWMLDLKKIQEDIAGFSPPAVQSNPQPPASAG